MEKNEGQFQRFAGVDWGSQWHEVCVIDGDGRQEVRWRIPHTAEGLQDLVSWLAVLEGERGPLAVAIEVPHGPVVETVVDAGFAVFAINPKQSDRFRDRHTVAGSKDDRRDAYVLADALRTDLPKFRHVAMPGISTVQLREMSRWHDELNGDLRRLSNRLKELLQRYFPAMLQLFPAADDQWFWELLRISGADPEKARRVRTDRIAPLLDSASCENALVVATNGTNRSVATTESSCLVPIWDL